MEEAQLAVIKQKQEEEATREYIEKIKRILP
jgi:hypothetical protein